MVIGQVVEIYDTDDGIWRTIVCVSTYRDGTLRDFRPLDYGEKLELFDDDPLHMRIVK